jgi:prephenate dehydrogenase
MPLYEHPVIIGCGLLGASLGLALKARGLAGTVTGVGRNQSTLDRARAVGAIDDASLALEDALPGADLIVIATPVAQSINILVQAAALAAPGAVLTDVGSTKAAICARADELWGDDRPFIGSHPMAGSEKFGPDHATDHLFHGAVCLVEESDNLNPAARERVLALWQGVGAKVVSVEARRHDTILAYTSHLPHVAASCVAAAAAHHGDVRAMVGNGFRDTTRIAASRPEVWTEICLTNRDAIIAGLRAYEHHLAGLRQALEHEDAAAVERFFEEGRAGREGILGE